MAQSYRTQLLAATTRVLPVDLFRLLDRLGGARLIHRLNLLLELDLGTTLRDRRSPRRSHTERHLHRRPCPAGLLPSVCPASWSSLLWGCGQG